MTEGLKQYLSEEQRDLLGKAAKAEEGPYAFESHGGDNYVNAPKYGAIMCDTQYYPWTPDPKTMEYMAAASPDVIQALLTELAESRKSGEMFEKIADAHKEQKDAIHQDYLIQKRRAEKAEAELAESKKKLAEREWISVEQELPPSADMVIVPGGIARYYAKQGGWYSYTACEGRPIQWDVTHWMPLPVPPAEPEPKQDNF